MCVARREAPAVSGDGYGVTGFALFGAPSPSDEVRSGQDLILRSERSPRLEGEEMFFDMPSRPRAAKRLNLPIPPPGPSSGPMAQARRLGYTFAKPLFRAAKGSARVEHGEFRHVVILVAGHGSGSSLCLFPRRRLCVHNAQEAVRQAFSAAFALMRLDNAPWRNLQAGVQKPVCLGSSR